MREHRTVLFVTIYDEPNDKYVERGKRLAESVNGENIKVDLYYVKPDVDCNALALQEGYDMMIVMSAPTFDLEAFQKSALALLEEES